MPDASSYYLSAGTTTLYNHVLAHPSYPGLVGVVTSYGVYKMAPACSAQSAYTSLPIKDRKDWEARCDPRWDPY